MELIFDLLLQHLNRLILLQLLVQPLQVCRELLAILVVVSHIVHFVTPDKEPVPARDSEEDEGEGAVL